MSAALKIWQEKKEFLEVALASCADPAQKFALRKQIEECESNILRLQSQPKQNTSQTTATNTTNQQPASTLGNSTPMSQQNVIKDVFLCHASEDKATVVRPLYQALTAANITCWLDEAEIQWGDSITKKVNDALANSRYVIVVLSEAVLNKNWPQRELFAVLNLEASSGEVKILPLIVGERTVLAKLPLLNDKAYLPWNNDPQPIVSALAKRLNIPNPL